MPAANFIDTFCSLFLNIVNRGKWVETQIAQIALFPITFATDCLKKCERFKCSILLLLILNRFEGKQLPITLLWYKS